MNIEKRKFLGNDALYFEAGGYEALMLPSWGANIVELKNKKLGVDIFRTPKSYEDLADMPQAYGIPILFPPNRIEDGKFSAEGKEYKFPINEVNNNNHIHGILIRQQFAVTKAEILEKEEAVEIEAVFESNRFNDAIYSYFKHEFQCKLNYRLSSEGLTHKVSFINKSKEAMPFGLGFHTAFNTPFCQGSSKEEYKLKLSVDKKWEVNSRMLPTGKYLPLSEEEKKYREEGMMPFAISLDTPYTVNKLNISGKEYHGAILSDIHKNISLFYEVGDEYKDWTVWNWEKTVDFLCPEPQTWAINAPNINLPAEETGFRMLSPGETWSEQSKIYLKKAAV
ncbi:aldose 1-epimerase [Clostridium sp. 19966]|uniref:aldose 1-epimerase n=1 Tax=Clostridium sp. 19966 TaxID=2768166 RepID=UPI0028E02942|nr:aldose 1-epimerase [Clostridium sp. 19966]MDT8715678.1 aldose 1-epimerase [Clostridium sp. 19966]